MVERYLIYPEGFPHPQRPSKPVYMVLSADHEVRIAELTAENERLNEGWDHTSKMLGAANARAYEAEKALIATLASTGAVKVKALDEDDYEEITNAAGIAMRRASRGIRGQVITVQDSFDWWVMKETERRILSALDAHPRATNTVDAHETADMSDKPEGQQEPIPRNVVWFGFDENTGEFTGEYCSVKPADARGIRPYIPYTARPSEQAMQVRITEAVYHIGFIKAMNGTTDEIREIADKAVDTLKAAMEAGR